MGQGLRLLSEELKQFSKPYYWVNMVLCLSFIFCKLVDPICSTLFSHYGIEACELDMRENEILFFLLIIIMIRYWILPSPSQPQSVEYFGVTSLGSSSKAWASDLSFAIRRSGGLDLGFKAKILTAQREKSYSWKILKQ